MSALAAAFVRDRRFLAWVAFLVATYAAIWLATDGLSFAPRKDEQHFWVAAMHFGGAFPPTLEALRSYEELTTPLAFVVWGQLDRLLGCGIAGARHLNLVLSFAVVALVGIRRPPFRPHEALCAVGLLLCPYYLALSAHMYTDVFALAFVCLGVWLHVRGRTWLAVVPFVLALSTRQYMIAFPLALIAWEVFSARNGRPVRVSAVAACGVAALAFPAWLVVFDGLAPAPGIARWTPQYDAPMLEVTSLEVDHGFYFLACIGAYFVVPEFVLFRRWRRLRAPWTREWAVAAAVVPLVLWISPFGDGALERGAHWLLGDRTAEVFVYAALAALAAARFTRSGLGFWIVLAHFVLMWKTQLAWDKYALPAVAALWLLASEGLLDPRRGSNQPPQVER